jgi:hypothetical protein
MPVPASRVEVRLTLQQICVLYQDNVIADRFLIDRVAEYLKTEPCRMLIRSVPEALEILYAQRTTRVDFRPSAVTSTFRYKRIPCLFIDYLRDMCLKMSSTYGNIRIEQ